MAEISRTLNSLGDRDSGDSRFKLGHGMQIQFNGEPRDVAPNVTIAALLQELQLNPRRVAVELNRDLIPREEHAAVVLAGGDTMEVVTLVGGG